ncbi:hypothetical protein [Chitinimonas sp. JJ19]|uniref:hypothetical protein n=1 Tax=Chitinimonas sp. JJ19 TaxID=3109352 RepID=UPI001A4A9E30|nr:helix-turn-helix domain-containing protein [Chitinimonas sp.]
MADEEAMTLALLQLLLEEDGLSIHKACKRLGLSLSELKRLLAGLGDSPQLQGLDLVRSTEERGRLRLWLTDKARALCQT